MMDLSPFRNLMVDAVLDRHTKSALDFFPEGSVSVAAVKEENETYRPFAEKDVDAIIDALRHITTHQGD